MGVQVQDSNRFQQVSKYGNNRYTVNIRFVDYCNPLRVKQIKQGRETEKVTVAVNTTSKALYIDNNIRQCFTNIMP